MIILFINTLIKSLNCRNMIFVYICNVESKLKNLSLSNTLFVFETNPELISQPRF